MSARQKNKPAVKKPAKKKSLTDFDCYIELCEALESWERGNAAFCEAHPLPRRVSWLGGDFYAMLDAACAYWLHG